MGQWRRDDGAVRALVCSNDLMGLMGFMGLKVMSMHSGDKIGKSFRLLYRDLSLQPNHLTLTSTRPESRRR